MKTRLSSLIFLVFLVCLTGSWTSPAAGKLYPPCQDITNVYLVSNNTGIHYGYTDPTTGVYMEETHYVVNVQSGGERLIILPEDPLNPGQVKPLDQGILTWIDRYINPGEAYYHYSVHYRIYDPGLGQWRGGSWPMPTPCYNSWIEQHQVKDGVVAFIAHWRTGPNPTDDQKHQVIYATYDPKLGTWAQGKNYWQKAYNDNGGPEVLRVRNGIVAWPNRNANGQSSGENQVLVHVKIYDYEQNFWNDYWEGLQGYDTPLVLSTFDWIRIADDTGDGIWVHARFSETGSLYIQDFYIFYDPYLHKWYDYGSSSQGRRAFFAAGPPSGVTPFRSWLWDCSYALAAQTNPSSYKWTVDGFTAYGRSPSFNCDSPTDHTYQVNLEVTYTDNQKYPVGGTNGQIVAQAPIPPPPPPPSPEPPPPDCAIHINNGAQYTNSANVTLSLSYDFRSLQMRFKQSPGLNQWLDNWEPVADSKAWTLSTIHELGTSPDGPHTVYAQFKDLWGNLSYEYSATITLVTTPPTAALLLDWGATKTTNCNVQVASLAASGYAGCPLQMSYAACEINKNGLAWGVWWTPWAPYPDWWPLYAVVPFSSPAAQKPIMIGAVQFKDAAGNITQVQAGIQLKPAPLTFLPLLLWD